MLLLQHNGFRCIEALVVSLMRTIGGVLRRRDFLLAARALAGVLRGFFVPRRRSSPTRACFIIAIGILGATVMPHNLYLHSSIVQTRITSERRRASAKRSNSPRWIRRVALMFALFINAAILIVAAATFHRNGHHEVGGHRGRLQAAVAAAGRGRLPAPCSRWRCWRRGRTRR